MSVITVTRVAACRLQNGRLMDDGTPWQRLLHRWFIQYNPLYLVSAALVLVGTILSARGLAGGGSLAQLGISAIAEVYAWSLIGGAALLVRIGLRRPAVMLALLAALYQCDLTLHTETCAHLGTIGVLGSAAWLMGSLAKLRALAWAMQLRLSRSVLVVVTLGASFVALVPWCLRTLEGPAASGLLGVGLLVVLAAGLWSAPRVEGRRVEPGWAATVARRSVRATWIGWSAMLLVHVGFWLSQHATLEGAVLVPVTLLSCTRFVRSEARIWLVVIGTLGGAVLWAPHLLAATAVMAAITLGLRALRKPSMPAAASPAVTRGSDDVYRVDATSETTPLPPPPASPSFALAPRDERLRLLTGVVGCSYLAVWAHGWSGGPWPAHAWGLDALLALASAVAFARIRRPTLLVPSALASAHLVVSLRVVPGPQSALEWGITCLGLGFALLVLSLYASVRATGRPRRPSFHRSSSFPGCSR